MKQHVVLKELTLAIVVSCNRKAVLGSTHGACLALINNFFEGSGVQLSISAPNVVSLIALVLQHSCNCLLLVR